MVVFLIFSNVDYIDRWKDPFNFGKMRAFLLASTIAIFHYAKKHVGPFVALFLCYQMILWVLHDYPLYGFWGVLNTITMVGFAIYLTLKVPAKSMAKAIVFTATFQCIFALLQVKGVYILFQVLDSYGLFKPIGTFGQETLLGAFLAASLPAALWLKAYWRAALIIFTCLVTRSSMTYAAMGAVIMLYTATFRPRAMLYTAISCALAVLLIWYMNPYLFHTLLDPNGRVFVWKKAVEAWAVNPITGGGPGFWAGSYQPDFVPKTPFGLRPKFIHCEYLEVLVEYGAIGGLLVLGAISSFIGKFRLSWHHVTCVAIFINALANFPIHLVATALIFLVSWVYSIRGDEDERSI